jgi:hypothetical protein
MWGQPVVIDNKGGGNGIPAAEVVARSKPDGLTMFATSAMTQAVNPAIYDKLPYDPIESFEAITRLGTSPFVLLVDRNSPINSAAELTAKLKAEPGKHNYGAGALARASRLRAVQDGGRSRGGLCRLQEQPAGDPRRAERPAHFHDDRHRERQARDRSRRAQGPVRDRRDALSAAAGCADGRGSRVFPMFC